jgi:hypothetical protein
VDSPSRPAGSRRVFSTAGLTVAVVLAWLNGLLVRTVTVDVQFFGETADRSDYRVAAGAGLMTALLLVLAVVALLVLAAPRWLQYVTAAGSATQLALGLTAWWSSRDVEETTALTESVWDGVKDALLFPGAWPLLVVLVLAAVALFRGRSSPAPR